MSESNQLLTTLQRHRNGGLLVEATEKMAQIVAAVARTGKPGRLTITLDVKPTKRGTTVFVNLKDKVVGKPPEVTAEESWWFATEDGVLTKNDPNQSELKFNPTAVQGGIPVDVETDTKAQAVNV